jgi:C4-dicarboxylate-specific signal transduction histidine kinase
VWVEVTARVERDTPDGELHVEALVRDVSGRRKLDDQARDLYQQLLQAEKMAALGQTISGVAHELNNPLATILSWSERLAQTTVDPVMRRGVNVILGEAERAARIVRNLLTFARKRQSTRAMIDINEVVRDTLALRTPEQRATGIAVSTALTEGLPRVFADGHQIQQVLLNLVINAEQAMRDADTGSSVEIRSWHDLERDAVTLEVTDDGPGVPEEVRQKIFDPFFTTKDVGQGTGLGPHGRLRDRAGTWGAAPRSVASHTPGSRAGHARRVLHRRAADHRGGSRTQAVPAHPPTHGRCPRCGRAARGRRARAGRSRRRRARRCGTEG